VTTTEQPKTQVLDAPERNRFEIYVDDELAGFADYRVKDGHTTIPHTEVFDRFGGRGLGSELVRGTLDALRERGAQVVPLCPFVAAYIRKNREYADLLAVTPAPAQPQD
jgi:predicted GNAT family acetyltransferase